jgi:predicted RNA-binding Zn ribbon-like protein
MSWAAWRWVAGGPIRRQWLGSGLADRLRSGWGAWDGGRDEPLPGYVRDWIERRDGPASDLDLAVLLVNSVDYLEDPPDRLASVDWFRAVAAATGRGAIAAPLTDTDLAGLRDLRESLRAVFAADSAEQAVARLNPMLLGAAAVPQLVTGPDGLELTVAPDGSGLGALAARLPAAVAQHLVTKGHGRLGTCAAGPCACAFVDYTRGRTRRFCSTACNDRAAARVYRQRKRGV